MTIRRPTPYAFAYAWWLTAMAGGEPEITNEPQAGFFKRRLVKQGPWVPARLWLDSEIDAATGELMADEKMLCEVNGEWADADEQWTYLAANAVTEAEFNYLTALRIHAVRHEPNHPAANPRRAINMNETPLHF